MFNNSWPSEIVEGVEKHLVASSGITLLDSGTTGNDLPLQVASDEKQTANLSRYAELRYDGPHFEQMSKSKWKVRIIVNILIVRALDNDLRGIHKDAGTVAAALTAFHIEDLDVCLDPESEIKIIHFGQVNPEVRIEQSTIERSYSAILG